MSKTKLPAIEGGTPIRKRFLPFSLPSLGEEEIKEVCETLRSGWLTFGPKTIKFEEEFKTFTSASYAIAVSSCTAALHLSLLRLNLKPGDEVITSPMTFAATANAIIHAGGKVVFADILPDTLNIDPEKIEEKISNHSKAILPIHIAGRPCEMKKILTIAKHHHLRVIEDAAHALGSSYQNKPIGSLSEFTCFSFYPTKNITAAEGGMITTESKEAAKQFQILRLHGMNRDSWDRHRQDGSSFWQLLKPGFKYNMTDLQAAIGRCQLKKLPAFKQRRAEIVSDYRKGLSNTPGILLPAEEEEGTELCWHLFIIQLEKEKLKISRDQFIDALAKENIGTSIHFISLHLQPYYRDALGFRSEDFPIAAKCSQRLISLPLYPDMTAADTQDVIQAVKKVAEFYYC